MTQSRCSLKVYGRVSGFWDLMFKRAQQTAWLIVGAKGMCLLFPQLLGGWVPG